METDIYTCFAWWHEVVTGDERRPSFDNQQQTQTLIHTRHPILNTFLANRKPYLITRDSLCLCFISIVNSAQKRLLLCAYQHASTTMIRLPPPPPPGCLKRKRKRETSQTYASSVSPAMAGHEKPGIIENTHHRYPGRHARRWLIT